MTKKLVWRLSTLPSVEELQGLVKDKIITQEEAREILFNTEEQKDRDKKSLETEIEFLRKLVEKLSQNKGQIITTIREIETPWKRYPWHDYYYSWCTADYTVPTNGLTLGNTSNGGSGSTTFTNSAGEFTSIKTF